MDTKPTSQRGAFARNIDSFESITQHFETALTAIAEIAAQEFRQPADRPILPIVSKPHLDSFAPTKPPTSSTDILQLVQQASEVLRNFSARTAPPGMMAMIKTSPNPFAIAADMLSPVFNQHVARGDLGALGAAVEQRAIEWIAEFVGYPARDGILTSGGSTALLTAFAAARSSVFGPAVRSKGVASLHNVVAYTSDQVHFSVGRALDLLGFGRNSLRRLPGDPNFRLDPEALENAILADREKGRRPWMVVANGGTVATGAVDPIDELARLCARHNLWLHVDAAYGGPAARAPSADGLFAGIDKADSISLDPHKWLYTTYESGCVLFREEGPLEAAFRPEEATYIARDQDTEWPDFLARGLELSRGFRGLKVWATFMGAGTKLLLDAIEGDIGIARRFAQLLRISGQFEIVSDGPLSIVTFRYLPKGLTDDDLIDRVNAAIPRLLVDDGRIYLGTVKLRERKVLRSCFVNYRTVEANLEEWIEIIARCGERATKDVAQQE